MWDFWGNWCFVIFEVFIEIEVGDEVYEVCGEGLWEDIDDLRCGYLACVDIVIMVARILDKKRWVYMEETKQKIENEEESLNSGLNGGLFCVWFILSVGLHH